MKVHAILYEFSYFDKQEHKIRPPDEVGGIVALYEDEDEAKKRLQKETDSGKWGNFSNASENGGWSSEGFILFMESVELIRRA